MNVELVSKTVPNEDYFRQKLCELEREGSITEEERERSLSNLDAEQLMIYIARVSSSRDNKLESYEGLLNYLIENKHWSPFEHAYMTVEIITSRAIARQFLRHRSFTFQELSQRYAKVAKVEPIELRLQADSNRQSSTEPIGSINYTTDEMGFSYYDYHSTSEETRRITDQQLEAIERLIDAVNDVTDAYEYALESGIARECARMVLPVASETTLYMTGNVRSWIHFLDLRDDEHTQLEAQMIAKWIKKLFIKEYPVISNTLNFT